MLPTDVLLVGYGPVGEMLTILLAQRGLTVTAVERWATPYNFPRAVSYDGEASRVLAAAGVADRLGPVVESSGEYTFKNGFGRTLLHVKVTGNGPMGWPDSVSFYQPGLEALLAETARRGVRSTLLEVAADNAPAQRLYAGYGFEPIGVRRGYYQPSNTDALVMQRNED